MLQEELIYFICQNSLGSGKGKGRIEQKRQNTTATSTFLQRQNTIVDRNFYVLPITLSPLLPIVLFNG